MQGIGADSQPALASLHPDDDLHPQTVVGHPFAVSPSVQAAQRNAPDPDADKLLTEFAHEERDVAWARQMETHLQQVLSGATTVRSIECRTSICMFEVSYTGQLNYDIYPDRSLMDQLVHENTMYGYEKDATSPQITVAVEIYRRRL